MSALLLLFCLFENVKTKDGKYYQPCEFENYRFKIPHSSYTATVKHTEEEEIDKALKLMQSYYEEKNK